MTHPDMCPYCSAPISPGQRARIDARLVCTCPVGFGTVADPQCPAHGLWAKHTISGPVTSPEDADVAVRKIVAQGLAPEKQEKSMNREDVEATLDMPLLRRDEPDIASVIDTLLDELEASREHHRKVRGIVERTQAILRGEV